MIDGVFEEVGSLIKLQFCNLTERLFCINNSYIVQDSLIYLGSSIRDSVLLHPQYRHRTNHYR